MTTRWWAISDDALVEMLERVHAGEPPGVVHAEFYANSDHEQVCGGCGKSALPDAEGWRRGRRDVFGEEFHEATITVWCPECVAQGEQP